ncbi:MULTISPECIES: SdpA family antimicrobial peptide system protein [Streptomyces]|uniref:SdpA family antimicrobial peptide system protein n=1 Tax=Streptomyces glycanivorans TaxID=3033808 RepID=A0ABY9J380_9ACTN|nr:MULTISPECIES: SdpA family antimicrobial peptide system protein [unclassified Streptomyces]WSQ75705.1 SdpA family antimicrobial peptide system protein [Streptomyces sp. NBC_01213]TXS10789.1 SdpA family antimicrobial peptide system protein [Streptomyces sp. wa22]WLQ62196.1 SdpA family antimicrobial peptide system protein [Streptomyces sp. Alt3]WSQ82950.1 SdpA family antimicrobial peptide system protein [Streptomyces sp. NBC_01212]WSR04625.1 SdpA family antimicrobial peptide system protein [St
MWWKDSPHRAGGRVTVAARHTVEVPRAWITGTAVLCVVVALYVAQTQLPKNVLSLPGQQSVKPVAVTVAPQGWAFFTKSARSPEFEPFHLDGSTWTSASLGRHSEHGFDRASRSQGIETALLLHEAGKTTRTDCGPSSVQECLKKARTVTAVTNRTPDPTLCGRTAVIEQKPTPWAWRDLLPDTRTPETVILLDVSC